MTQPSPKSIFSARFWLGIGSLVLALVCLGIGYTLPYGVTHTLTNGQLMPTEFVWLDHFPRVSNLPGASGALSGALNRPASSVVWLENNIGAQVTVKFADEILYEGSDSIELRLPDTAPDPIPFKVTYQMPDEPVSGGQFGFMQTGLLGNRYVQPAWDFVPRSFPHELARIGFWLFVAAGMGCLVTAFHWQRRAMLAALVIWLLALSVQAVTLTEKLNSGTTWWGMTHTWDNYVYYGRTWLEGNKPIPGQEAQQGNYIYLGAATLVLGPEVSAMYRLNAIAGSFVPVLLLLAVWGLFQRPTPAILTGMLAALFMPLVHYQQSLQPESIANLVIALLLGAGVLLIRQPRWGIALLAGLLVGWLGILRGSWLIFIGWVGLALLLSMSLNWRRRVVYGVLAFAGMALALAPMIYLNFSAGFYMLTPSKSEVHLFRANNMDSMGLTSYGGISERWAIARGKDWDAALRRDVQRDPMRVVELTLRRLGLIWQSEEHSDSGQADYEQFSYELSPTTKLLSLQGNLTVRTLLVVALFGIICAVLAKEWRATFLLAGGAAAWAATLLPFYTLGRTRIGLVIFLLPLAGYALAQLWVWRRDLPKLVRVAIVGVLLNAIILWGADWLVNNMPRPQIISASEIPAEFVPVEGVFDNQVKLLGYAFYESNHQPEGYLTFELFWQALNKPTDDYIAAFWFVDTTTQEVVQDVSITIGTTRPPMWQMSHWNAGDMFFERYLLTLPKPATPRAYTVYVGVVSEEQNRTFPVVSAQEIRAEYMRIMSVWVGDVSDETNATTQTPLALWGDALALTGQTCAINNDELNLTLDWQIQQHVPLDWRFFVHGMAGDTLAAQHDGRLDELHPPDGLPIRYRWTTSYTLSAAEPLTSVRIGFYNPADMARVAVGSMSADYAQADDTLIVPCE
jgi:hypothetical protein